MSSDNALLKKGLDLPKSDSQWNEANKAILSLSDINENNLDNCVRNIAETACNYFASNYGTVQNQRSVDMEFKGKYKESSKQLKIALKRLEKSSVGATKSSISREIKCISELLRCKANIGNTENINSKIETSYRKMLIKESFWKYAEEFITNLSEVVPTFDRAKCLMCFSKVFRSILPSRIFCIPDWIPSLPMPTSEFNMELLSYRDIKNIVRKMKTSSSFCPLDQTVVIVFKRSPYLTTLILQALKTQTIQTNWKRTVPLLIYTKEETANFRPITLQATALKIMTSLMKNIVQFQFLTENVYAEHNIQKGFTPKVDGTLERTLHMAYLINHVKKKSSFVITLIDLKKCIW